MVVVRYGINIFFLSTQQFFPGSFHTDSTLSRDA